MREDEDMTITEFLLARIAEDEDVAREVQEKTAVVEITRFGTQIHNYYEDVEGFELGVMFDVDYNQGGVTISAARVLAECAAKRAIVAEHDDLHECAPNGTHDPTTPAFGPCNTLCHLATIYADHPDYREEWKP